MSGSVTGTVQFGTGFSVIGGVVNLAGLFIDGPPSSVDGSVVIFSGTSGGVVADSSGAFPLSFGATPTSAATINIGAFPSSSEIPQGTFQGLDVSVVVPSTFTGAPWPATGISQYIVNNNPNGGAGGSAVANFVVAFQGADQASVWAYNGVLTNNATVIDLNGTQLGHDIGTMIGIELDFNVVRKAGGIVPSGILDGVRLIGDSYVLPSFGASAVHVMVLGIATNLAWSGAFVTDDGAAAAGMSLGALGTGISQNSQPIFLHGYKSDGSLISHYIQSLSNDTLAIGAPVVSVQSMNLTAELPGYQIETATVLSRDSVGHTVYLNDYASNPAIIMGATPGTAQNFYRNTSHVFQTIAGAANLMLLGAAGALATTAMSLQVHNNGGTTEVPVTLGAADSGGTGFRALIVPN